jgi:hypothetical protein
MKTISKNTFCMLALMSLLLVQVSSAVGFTGWNSGTSACTISTDIPVKLVAGAPTGSDPSITGNNCLQSN